MKRPGAHSEITTPTTVRIPHVQKKLTSDFLFSGCDTIAPYRTVNVPDM